MLKRLGAASLLTFVLALIFTPFIVYAQDVVPLDANTLDPTKLVEMLFTKVMNGEWAEVAALALVGVTYLSRQKKSPLRDWLLKVSRGYWDIKKDRGGAILVLVLGLAGGVLTLVTGGGIITGPLILATLKTALTESVMSAGGFVLVKKLFFPSDEIQSDEDAAVKEAQTAALAAVHTAPTPPGGTDTNSPLNE